MQQAESGLTFLAAVEYLFKHKPLWAIFENVLMAPWGKMVEYVEGRITLSTCGDKKGVKPMSASEKKVKDLELVIDKDGNFVSDAIPLNIGVKTGQIVEGVIRYSDGKQVVEPLNLKLFQEKNKSKLRLRDDKKTNYVTLADIIAAFGLSNRKDESDILVFATPVNYVARVVKVDTKNYGLPHTRNRGYMVIFKSDDHQDNLPLFVEAIVRYMELPLKHSLDSFLVGPDHPVMLSHRGERTKRQIGSCE